MVKVKKIAGFIGIIAVIFVSGFILWKVSNKEKGIILYKDAFCNDVYLSAVQKDVSIHAVFNGNGVYLCLPSFFEAEVMYIDDTIESICIDGEKIGNKWKFQYNHIYWCQVTSGGNTAEFPFCIVKSENMDTMFIDTKSGSMDYVWEDKGNEEAGTLVVYNADGAIVSSGELEYIRGRGNTTWYDSLKRPYNIKFAKKTALMGMGEAKKWTLLANAFESSKLANVMAQDMAKDFGMSTWLDSKWVDLYLNGSYVGNYLVCESIDIDEVDENAYNLQDETELLNPGLKELERAGLEQLKGVMVSKNPENISGTYIVERDVANYYSTEVSGFQSEDGNYFTIKEPKYASVEQAEYISGVVQNVENLMRTKDSTLFDYVDIHSLAVQYFVDTFMGNCDMGVTSVYFYKKTGDDKLYAGPVWDYDRVFGIFDHSFFPYDKEMSEMRQEEMLTWISYLMENEEFITYCREFYIDTVRPYILHMLKKGVDDYAEQIQDSYDMDSAIWTGNSKFYKTLDANVRYIKFYLAERMKLMDEKFGVTGETVEFTGNGVIHAVTVRNGEEDKTYGVMDGECFTELEEIDTIRYYWWIEEESGFKFDERMPILEDIVITGYEKP
ncbi:MAG: CotH kinase family protein [Thermoflexaceae bacterium]|nr:CotH kinase family protein [Thermoflexaceae bacterium]